MKTHTILCLLIVVIGLVPFAQALLQKRTVADSSILCNDGTPYVYYVKLNPHSSRWILYLNGGWLCFDRNTCQQRWESTPYLMTSKGTPDTWQGQGILSDSALVNPHWFDDNIVMFPYCSSDLWSGNKTGDAQLAWHFKGAAIIDAVTDELIRTETLGSASQVLLSGSSAGGVGVIVNLDRLAERLPWAVVHGFSDSGWFIDHPRFVPGDCETIYTCQINNATHRGVQIWNPVIPPTCKWASSPDLRNLCYIGRHIFDSLKNPLFSLSYMYDGAQFVLDGLTLPLSKEAEQYAEAAMQELLLSLQPVKGVFVPDCYFHGLIPWDKWTSVTIGGVSISDVLFKWWNLGQDTIRLVDSCTSMNCNPTCPKTQL